MSFKMYRLTAGSLRRNIYTNRILCGSHYDTLKLPRDCTTKDIRDSFIRLSKQCHPDKNQNDPSTHAQFIKVNEAYHILNCPDKRRLYDLTLKPEARHSQRHEYGPFDVDTATYRQRVVWQDKSFWNYGDQTKHDFNKDSEYYGIKGLKRVHNGWIAVLIIVFSAIGICFQVFLIRKSRTFNRQCMEEQSNKTGRVLLEVQQQALVHGNKVQLEEMKQRLSASQTWTQKDNDKAQEMSTGDVQNTSHASDTSEPHVIVVLDTETQEVLEMRK